METPILQFVRENLPKSLPALRELAPKVGVPAKTMEKIARGYTENPRFETVQRIYDYLRNAAA